MPESVRWAARWTSALTRSTTWWGVRTPSAWRCSDWFWIVVGVGLAVGWRPSLGIGSGLELVGLIALGPFAFTTHSTGSWPLALPVPAMIIYSVGITANLPARGPQDVAAKN